MEEAILTPLVVQGEATACLTAMPTESVHCIITSPPYWGLREYGGDPAMIGMEPTFADHRARLVALFAAARRVLRREGTLWLNYGDGYADGGRGGGTSKQPTNRGAAIGRKKRTDGYKHKDLMMMPAKLAIALQDDGWYLRSEIIWHKTNPFPESVRDRPSMDSERVYLLTKSATPSFWTHPDKPTTYTPPAPDWTWEGPNRTRRNRWRAHDYYYNPRGAGPKQTSPSAPNLRTVWSMAKDSFHGAHFAVMPQKLVERCMLLGCPPGGIVLDPFAGAGTVGVVAAQHRRRALLIEINQAYARIAWQRIVKAMPVTYRRNTMNPDAFRLVSPA